MDPFDTLVNLARRSQKAGGALPEKETTRRLWTGIGFGLFDRRFVVELAEVAELMRIPSFTTLPETRPWVMGVANVRGRLLTIVDLAVLFGQGSAMQRTQRRVLVIDREDDYFGFVVDESLGMQHFPREGFEEQVDEEVDEKYAAFIKGSFVSGGITWPVFSLFALLDDERIMNLAGSTSVQH